MKIFYIAPQALPSRAANGIHVMKMAQALARSGHQVTLCFQKSASEIGDIFQTYGVDPVFKLKPCLKLPGLPGNFIFALYNFLAALMRRSDLVFSRHLLTAWLCAGAGMRVLFEIHDSPSALNPLARKFFRSLTRQKNVSFIVISDALSRHVQQSHSIVSRRIILAPDGADEIPLQNISAPFEKKTGHFQAGYTGHLYRGRGIDIIGELAEKMPDIHFHIVGGAAADIAYWKNRFSNCDNLAFHGHVPHADIAHYLAGFDALLAPYQKKVAVGGNTGDTGQWMSPLKIFEYMAAGKAIICSDLPVLREVLNETNAILCPPDDAEAWREALEYLQKNPDSALRLGQNALQVFQERYTWRKRAKTILDFVNADG